MIDLQKLNLMFDTLFSDEAIEEKFWDWYVSRNKSASTAKPNVSGELPSDESKKCDYHAVFTFCGDNGVTYCSNCGDPL